jgi:hypothetical protein
VVISHGDGVGGSRDVRKKEQGYEGRDGRWNVDPGSGYCINKAIASSPLSRLVFVLSFTPPLASLSSTHTFTPLQPQSPSSCDRCRRTLQLYDCSAPCPEIPTSTSSGSSASLLPAESGLHTHSEVEQTLSATHNLLASYECIASTSSSTSSAVSEARDELRGTLALLEADLEDLDESVRVVESTGDRWGIAPDEVSRRRGFVERVKKEVRVRDEWTRRSAKEVHAKLMLMGIGLEG